MVFTPWKDYTVCPSCGGEGWIHSMSKGSNEEPKVCYRCRNGSGILLTKRGIKKMKLSLGVKA